MRSSGSAGDPFEQEVPGHERLGTGVEVLLHAEQVRLHLLHAGGDPACAELDRDGGRLLVVGVAFRRAQPAGAEPSSRLQEAVHLGRMHPGQQLGVLGRVLTAVGRDPTHPPVDALDVADRRPRLGPCAEGGDRDEVGRPAEAADGVLLVGGVIGDAGHGEGVERLEHQGCPPADDHRSEVAVDLPHDAVGMDEGRLRVHRPGAGCHGQPEGVPDAATNVLP